MEFAADGQEVAPESSTGIVPSPDPSSAGTQNTDVAQGQVQDARGNVLPAWRVEQIRQQAAAEAYARAMAERAQWQTEQQAKWQQQAAEREQRLIQALQQRSQQPSRTPQEEVERQQAQRVLRELAPELGVMKPLIQSHLELQRKLEQQQAALARIDTLEQKQRESFGVGEEARLRSLAAQAGYKLTDQQFSDLNDRVAEIIAAHPKAKADFLAGHSGVVPWAFQVFQTRSEQDRRAAAAALNQTKTQTMRLPPRPGGSIPGQPTQPKLNPNDPASVRLAERRMSDRLLAAVQAG